MKTSLQIGKIMGIPIQIHWSWILVFFLVTFSLSTGYINLTIPGLTTSLTWMVGILTSLLFFLSILAHELGHSILALRNHIQVRSISLFMFGGVAQIEQEPDEPGVEFRIAIAGPLTSILLGVIFGLIAMAFEGLSPLVSEPARWLARVNLTLALFNMIPGFPLDGGRVLHSLIWKFSQNAQTAKRWATGVGRVVAIGFIGVGLVYTIRGDFFNGIWLAFIGLFLNDAARAYQSPYRDQQGLDDVKVSQIMNRDLERIPANLLLSQLVDNGILAGGHNQFLVGEETSPRGMLTFQELAAIPRHYWESTSVEQAMTPWTRLVRLPADMGLATALRVMDSYHLILAPVVQGNVVAGLLTREKALEYLVRYHRNT